MMLEYMNMSSLHFQKSLSRTRPNERYTPPVE